MNTMRYFNANGPVSLTAKMMFAVVLSMPAAMAHAQDGIEFYSGTWQQALAKAKAENKPLFVDVYTSWCGPCKQMAKDVFTSKDVGAKFNASFINYKVDAGKGEGVKTAQQFGVKAYPTYLFVKGDGVLAYRTRGAMPARNFIREADKALTEFKDPKPLPLWEAEYPSNKTDKAFLLHYLQKRENLGLYGGEALDQYVSLSSKEELLSKDILTTLLRQQAARVDGAFYSFLVGNKTEVAQASGKPVEYVDAHLEMYARSDLDRAIENRDPQLMEKIVAATLAVPATPGESDKSEWRADRIRMRFFADTENEPELVKVLDRYSRQVMSYDNEKIMADDAKSAQEFEKMLKNPPKGAPAGMESRREFFSKLGSMEYAYTVRDIAGAALQSVSDKKILNEALQWIQRAETYSNNFSIYETRAGLLYKLGRAAEGMQEQNKAIAAFDSMKIPSDDIRNRLTGNLEKMKAGEPTWIPEKKFVSV